MSCSQLTSIEQILVPPVYIIATSQVSDHWLQTMFSWHWASGSWLCLHLKISKLSKSEYKFLLWRQCWNGGVCYWWCTKHAQLIMGTWPIYKKTLTTNDLNKKNFHLIKYLLTTFIFFLSFQSVLVVLWGWFSCDVLPVTCCEHGPPSIATFFKIGHSNQYVIQLNTI